MKGKSYYGVLITLIIVGIASFSFYQRKQEERLLEFEGYEISSIEDRVDALYNKEKTDIVEDISEDEFDDLDQIFLKLEEKDLHKENERRIRDMGLGFLMAREMNRMQENIRSLFDNKVVVSSAKVKDIERLEKEIEPFNSYSVYYERNKNLLDEGKEQLVQIKEAKDLVKSLLDDEGNLLPGVTQDDLNEALELIEDIKNTDVRAALTDALDVEIIVEEEIEEDDQLPTQEEESSTSQPSNTNNNSSSSGSSGSSGSSTGNSGGATGSTGSNSNNGGAADSTGNSSNNGGANGNGSNNNDSNDDVDNDIDEDESTLSPTSPELPADPPITPQLPEFADEPPATTPKPELPDGPPTRPEPPVRPGERN